MKPDFLIRMEDELSQLNERLTKLNAFITKKDKVCISDEECELLQQQSNAMSIYKYFLNERVKFYQMLFKKEIK
jgi:hypothetical protein